MELYIIRHAIAEDREEFRLKSWDDSQRPLTIRGKKKFKKVAAHIADLIGPIDIIVTSPFRRALQTAKIFSEHYPKTKIVTSPALTPMANPNDFAKWCKENLKKKNSRIVIVGHEPHLSILTSWLLFGSYQSRIVIKKGGCLALTIKEDMAPESGILQWAITPKSLGVE